MARTLLLTGATGFVGRNFLIAALRSGEYAPIYVAVRDPNKLRRQLEGEGFSSPPPNVIPIVGTDSDWNVGSLGVVDDVVHAAGQLSGRTREDYFRTNVQGTLSLLGQLQHPRAIVVVSSQAAGGPCVGGQERKSEDDRDEPVTWYGESKAEMEQQILRELPGLNVIFLRPPMVLGPRDQATRALFQLVALPVHFKPGLRDMFYSYIAVEDLVRAISTALQGFQKWRTFRHRHFFVAAPEPVSIRDLLSLAAEVSGRRGVIVPVPKSVVKVASIVIESVPRFRNALPNLSKDRVRELWPDRWVSATTNFETAFAWRARENLRSTLQSTYDWYLRTGQL